MEYPTPPPTSLFQLNIDPNSAATLRGAASWSKVLGVLGIIFGVLILIIGLAYQSLMGSARYGQFEDYGNRSASLTGNVVMITCILFGVLTIIGSIFALNFGGKITRALRTNDSYTLRGGFAGIRNYFAFWSILMIIYFLLMILTIAMGSFNR